MMNDDKTDSPSVPTVPTVELSSGFAIPQVGLGVLRVAAGQTQGVVESALQVGYRHIDAAAGYENEAEVGAALAASGFNSGTARQSLFVTTKLRDSEQGYDSALKAFDRQLADLRLDYVDMYMIHWPTPFDWRSDQVWQAFTKLRDEGRVRTLGVCNFLPEHLQRLYDEVGEYPAVNQLEIHPSYQQREVAAFSQHRHIVVESYSPLARGKDLTVAAGAGTGEAEGLSDDGLSLPAIAAAHHKSVAQVVLRWHIQQGYVVVPKSVHPARQAQNLDLFDFELTKAEMAAISALDRADGSMGHDPRTFSYS